jgi:hypothetical protein
MDFRIKRMSMSNANNYRQQAEEAAARVEWCEKKLLFETQTAQSVEGISNRRGLARRENKSVAQNRKRPLKRELNQGFSSAWSPSLSITASSRSRSTT